MGGEKDQGELAAIEALMARCIADALVAQLQEEAAAHGVDVWRRLAREKSKDVPLRDWPGRALANAARAGWARAVDWYEAWV